MLDSILLEQAGVPSISIVTEPFVETGEEMAATWGVPAFRFLTRPHPIANLTEAELDAYADGLVDDVVALLQQGQPEQTA